jgi:hypothetical protein
MEAQKTSRLGGNPLTFSEFFLLIEYMLPPQRFQVRRQVCR